MILFNIFAVMHDDLYIYRFDMTLLFEQMTISYPHGVHKHTLTHSRKFICQTFFTVKRLYPFNLIHIFEKTHKTPKKTIVFEFQFISLIHFDN